MIENMNPTKLLEGAVNFGGKMGEFDSMPKMDLGTHFNLWKIFTTWSPKNWKFSFFSL
jgi:hypothetical protein